MLNVYVRTFQDQHSVHADIPGLSCRLAVFSDYGVALNFASWARQLPYLELFLRESDATQYTAQMTPDARETAHLISRRRQHVTHIAPECWKNSNPDGWIKP